MIKYLKTKFGSPLVYALAFLGILSILASFGTIYHYQKIMPREPIGERTMALDVHHGKNVFVTRKEYIRYRIIVEYLPLVGVILIFIAGYYQRQCLKPSVTPH